jgi:hypothetical protein
MEKLPALSVTALKTGMLFLLKEIVAATNGLPSSATTLPFIETSCP